MTKKRSDSSNPQNGRTGESSTSESEISPTSKAITDRFKRTQHLITIQLQSTILYEDLDEDRGAKPFRELVRVLFKDIKLTDLKPAALWVVSDEAELEHVVREMRKHDKELYINLSAHASVALVDSSSKYSELLSIAAALGPNSELRQTLTASPAVDGNGYDYLAHFKASTREGLEGETLPFCVKIDDVPSQFDDFLLALSAAHYERLSRGKGAKSKNLLKSGIQLKSLEDLTGEPVSSHPKK